MDLSYPIGKFDWTQTVTPERRRQLINEIAAAPANFRHHDNDIRPQSLELALHERAGALSERDHRGDGGNADHDAQHGETGPHLVLGERPQGDPNRDGRDHFVT